MFFGDQGDRITAEDGNELRRKLAEVDDYVPERTKGRTAEHRERRAIVLYLRALERAERLDYPVEVEKSEAPDFLVTSAGRPVALEVTEAGTPASQRASTELEKLPKGTMIEGEATLVAPGGRLTGRGWVGDEAERQWADIVLGHVQKKTETLRGYAAGEYHLLVYDNTHLPIADDVETAAGYLRSIIHEWEESASPERRFSRISVVKESRVVFDVKGECATLAAPGGSAASGSSG